MEDELLKEEKPRIIKLGDKEYTLSPLSLNVLCRIEEEFDCGLSKVGDLLTKRQATTMRSLIYILLKDGYPEITKEEIGKMVKLEDLEQICTMINNVLIEK